MPLLWNLIETHIKYKRQLLLPWRQQQSSQHLQTASRFAVTDAGSRGRQVHPVNTPPFPQSHPKANLHPLGVSPTCSQPAQVQQLLQGDRRRIEVELGNPWRCAGWLWAWLEQQPSLPKSVNAACRRDNEMNEAFSLKFQKNN